MGTDIEDANPVEIDKGQVFIDEMYKRDSYNYNPLGWGPAIISTETTVLDDPNDSIKVKDVGTGESRELTYGQLLGKGGYDPINHSASYPDILKCDGCSSMVVTESDLKQIVKDFGVPSTKKSVAKNLVEEICKQLGDIILVISIVHTAKSVDYEKVTEYMENGELIGGNSSKPIISCAECGNKHKIPTPARNILEF